MHSSSPLDPSHRFLPLGTATFARRSARCITGARTSAAGPVSCRNGPDNPVVKLCVQAMECESSGRPAEASRLFMRAWVTGRPDINFCHQALTLNIRLLSTQFTLLRSDDECNKDFAIVVVVSLTLRDGLFLRSARLWMECGRA